MNLRSTLTLTLTLNLLLLGSACLFSMNLGAQNIAIYGDTIHTMAKTAEGKWQDPIENGVVLIVDGKISAVGPQSSVEVPEGTPEMRCSRHYRIT